MISYTKYNSCGNDFIIVDDTEEEGGQAPKEIYLKALTDGFKLRERVNSLVLLD